MTQDKDLKVEVRRGKEKLQTLRFTNSVYS